MCLCTVQHKCCCLFVSARVLYVCIALVVSLCESHFAHHTSVVVVVTVVGSWSCLRSDMSFLDCRRRIQKRQNIKSACNSFLNEQVCVRAITSAIMCCVCLSLISIYNNNFTHSLFCNISQ